MGEEAGGVTCGPRPAVQPSLESFGVAAGQLIEQLGSGGDQAQSLAGGHCVLQGVELVRHRQHSSLAEVGVKVVALSVDDEATGAALVTKHHLGFPVGHSADADAVASATGAWWGRPGGAGCVATRMKR